MVLDKFAEFEIKGKTHKLCYPLKYVWEAERQLMDRNFILIVANAANNIPPSMGDIYVMFKYALLGGNPLLTEKEADELYLAAVEDNDPVVLLRAALDALKKSGALGKGKKAQAAPEA